MVKEEKLSRKGQDFDRLALLGRKAVKKRSGF
jgi:hypothetical protein